MLGRRAQKKGYLEYKKVTWETIIAEKEVEGIEGLYVKRLKNNAYWDLSAPMLLKLNYLIDP